MYMGKEILYEEICRIQELMNLNSKKTMNDLNLFEDVTNQTTTKCKTTVNPIKSNEVSILAFDVSKLLLRAGMKIYFGSTKTEAQIKDSFDKLYNLVLGYEGLNEDVKNKIKSGKYVLNIPTVLNVIGSASSLRGVGVMPTITNDKAEVAIGSINTDSFATNINRSDAKYKNLKDDETNNGYASGRINTITDFIRTGKMAQLQSGQDVEVKKSIAVITDTGACDDEHRDTTKYPNPGQFAFLEIYVTIKEKMVPPPLPSSCINKITLKIGYDKDQVKTEAQKHNCDFGIFRVYANDVFIRDINLNNHAFDLGTKDTKTNTEGLKITDFTDGRVSDGLDGGTRMYTIEIKQNTPLWNNIMANATKFGNHIRISYQGFASTWYAGKKIYASGARTVKFNNQFIGPAKDSNNNDVQSHSSAVYLDITLNRTDNKQDNVKGWTKNGARGTEMVTIADLIPCTAESSQRINLV